ncbi:hypothetical protein CANCADRAFT_55814 [Tortispora caseinolytica NRRL Y-17796]|uniref:SGS domain-containing protein n=1 Tax=Tortispora caseinolytica NRRL Y-17796 TaxID=767744 RepID=A0A1E4TJW9_9ASCO|nr:hypothetical protein CANCADRAFT_55814 [Tortispora caseinolytica NRRL Y-17796]
MSEALKICKNLINNKQYEHAEDAISYYLSVDSSNVEIIELKAQLMYRQNDLYGALDYASKGVRLAREQNLPNAEIDCLTREAACLYALEDPRYKAVFELAERTSKLYDITNIPLMTWLNKIKKKAAKYGPPSVPRREELFKAYILQSHDNGKITINMVFYTTPRDITLKLDSELQRLRLRRYSSEFPGELYYNIDLSNYNVRWYGLTQRKNHVTLSLITSVDLAHIPIPPFDLSTCANNKGATNWRFSETQSTSSVPQEASHSATTTDSDSSEVAESTHAISSAPVAQEPPVSDAPVTKSTERIPDAAPQSKAAEESQTAKPKTQKNWDKIVAELDESEDELENATDPEQFFKALYRDVDEDARRAMMKSYYESGGTTLSTDWSDVGQRHVDYIPPSDH